MRLWMTQRRRRRGKRHPVLGAVLVLACLAVLLAGLQVYIEWGRRMLSDT
jgi:hypothetical protein